MKRIVTCMAIVSMLFGLVGTAVAGDIACWFPPDWKSKGAQAKEIADALTAKSGVTVKPRIATSYPQVLDAFTAGEPCLVYVGSFVQAIIRERGIGVPLVQAVNGKEFYGAWMIFPEGGNPAAILRENPEKIAYTAGASSGESGAKAATAGKAAIRVASHDAAANAVKAGAAKAAFVKNWWWQANKEKFPGFVAHQVAGISDAKNPDNVLTASKGVPEAVRSKISEAAMGSAAVFGAQSMRRFDSKTLDFTVGLMHKGGIDPKAYSW